MKKLWKAWSRASFILVIITRFSFAATLIDFNHEKKGVLPSQWSAGVTGDGSPRWTIEQDRSSPKVRKVLKQSGEGTYSWCILKKTSIADGFVEVMIKPESGKEDQAGGVVWRWKDPKNYYIARANALEDNVTLFYTIDGKRHSFKNVDIKVATHTWHTLRVEFSGNHSIVFFDEKKVLEADDDQIQGAGAIGVWTKADSVTLFDQFKYENQSKRKSK